MGKRFNELSDTDKSYLKVVHANTDLSWDHRMSILMNKYDKGERTIRLWLKRLGISNYERIENEEIRQGKVRAYDLSKRRFIITWAQNATPIHDKLWKNILKYAEKIDANVGVIQGRYQNPTSIWTANMQKDEWWDPAIHGYEDAARQRLHSYLDLLSDLKIRPTAVNPLTGLEGLSGNRSSIIGHPRVHFKSLPVLKGHPNKYLMTTGSCTVKNYTDTKAGKKAEFHHTYGFVVVEIQDDYTFMARQVTANNDGSFTDLSNRVVDGKISKIKDCSAFICGDFHCKNIDEQALQAFTSMFKVIRPENIVIHDIFDGESINHHESKDPIKAYHRFRDNNHLIRNELDELIDLIDRYGLIEYDPIVVRSNHDVWIEKWIAERDWKKDIVNAAEYMEYALALLKGDAPKGIIPYVLDQHYGDGIITLDLDDSYKVNGWELAQHGHLGAHGSKGNINQYKKLNTKIIIGDYHQPSRQDGAIGVGTFSKKRLGYNHGPSAWAHAGAIVHKDSKAQLLVLTEDYKFTTFEDFN